MIVPLKFRKHTMKIIRSKPRLKTPVNSLQNINFCRDCEHCLATFSKDFGHWCKHYYCKVKTKPLEFNFITGACQQGELAEKLDNKYWYCKDIRGTDPICPYFVKGEPEIRDNRTSPKVEAKKTLFKNPGDNE